MRNQEITLGMEEALHILYVQPEISSFDGAEHLDGSLLMQMTAAGGLSEALPADKHHLSLCSHCLNRWQLLLNSRASLTDTDTVDRADDWFTGGYLEACADHELDLPLSLSSQCGRFILGVYRSEQEHENLLFTIDYCNENDSNENSSDEADDCPEGSLITVNDRCGMLLLSAPLCNGRAAARLETTEGQMPDLSSWTIRVQSHGVGQT